MHRTTGERRAGAAAEWSGGVGAEPAGGPALRVAMVTSLYPPSVGGIQSHTRALARALAGRGAEIHVVTRRAAGHPDRETLGRLHVHRVGAPAGVTGAAATLAFVAGAVARVGEIGPDLIHAHQLLSPTTVALVARAAHGTPILLNPHACGAIGDVGVLSATPLGRLRLRATVREADRFVAISGAIRAELLAAGVPEARIVSIPNGVDLERFRPAGAQERIALRRALGLAEAPTVVYTGRLSPEKGADVLVAAWPAVARAVPGARLILLGDGAERERLLEAARAAGVAGSVALLGAAADVAPYVRAADAAVLPSRTEGLPVALLEAMACEVPVVATAVGGSAEILRDGATGRLVPPARADALAAGLVEALTDRAARARAHLARDEVAARYGLDRIVGRFLEVYAELRRLGPARRAGPTPLSSIERDPAGARRGRVAYLMSWFPAPTETFILNELLELRRQGIEIDVFPLLGAAPGPRHPGVEELMPRVRYHRALSLELLLAQLHWIRRRPRPYLRTWWRALAGNRRSVEFLAKAIAIVPRAALVAREIEARAPAHVHAHWATHPALAALVVRELTGIGYSFTAHAHDLYENRSMLGEKIAEARFVVTVSEHNRSLIGELYGPAAAAKTAVVRCGVDLRRFRPRERVGRDVPLVVCVAGLRDYKGQRYLVDACALLRDRGVAFRCVLVGDGPERASLEAGIRAARLAGEVRLLGARGQDEVQRLLATADVAVHPSITTRSGMMDGIPVALMEAMASGCPVVATRVSGIPELVEDERSGLLVEPRNPAQLADAVQRLLADPALRQRLATAGRSAVIREFALERNVRRLVELFAVRGAVPVPPPEPRAVPVPLEPGEDVSGRA